MKSVARRLPRSNSLTILYRIQIGGRQTEPVPRSAFAPLTQAASSGSLRHVVLRLPCRCQYCRGKHKRGAVNG